MTNLDEKCPQCGGELERDEADVGVGVMYGPAGCPACFWVEGDPIASMASTMPTMPTPISLKTCKECRYVGTHTRPKIISKTGFGDQLMFENADKDETVYTCKAPYAPGDVTGGLMMPLRADGTAGVPGGMHVAVLGEPGCSEYAGKEIGIVPITCSAWDVPAPATRLSELDRMIAAREARVKARGDE